MLSALVSSCPAREQQNLQLPMDSREHPLKAHTLPQLTSGRYSPCLPQPELHFTGDAMKGEEIFTGPRLLGVFL